MLDQFINYLSTIPDFVLVLLLKPFVFFFLVLFVLYPIRSYLTRKMPEGKLKRLLLHRIS